MMKTHHVSFNIFETFSNLVCQFSTRNGGISVGDFTSLNLGLRTGDNQDIVKQNRAKFFQDLDVTMENIAFTDQVHSSRVEIVRESKIYPESDGLITDQKNLFLVIQTADCFPVFMYDPVTEVVAAVHCGWRSVFKGILENTITLMRNHFEIDPQNILTAIGPGLQKECFEVRADLYEQVEGKYLSDYPEAGKRLFDLQKMIIDILNNQGVCSHHVSHHNQCTKCNGAMFYSFRRDGQRSGRMMGVIGIRS